MILLCVNGLVEVNNKCKVHIEWKGGTMEERYLKLEATKERVIDAVWHLLPDEIKEFFCECDDDFTKYNDFYYDLVLPFLQKL